MKSFSSSEVVVSAVLEESLSEEDVISLSGSGLAGVSFAWHRYLRDKKTK